MTTAREIMHAGVECVGEHENLQNAARRMRQQNVGALPICGDDDRLHGILTDRDIVVKCVAAGGDPASMTAGELAQGSTLTVSADDDIDNVLRLMEEHHIRRLPVIENHRLVGMISEVDLGRHLSEDQVTHFVEVVSAAKT
ncbi:CBS domain-containing protein [Actinopolymorpha sp. NPDC004070]|uniref:CBS domain-containing protein n=1 Tax=Actinopolymorpha sp. NPDC004070 TaxID=3154548 RepID=UPI0033B25754